MAWSGRVLEVKLLCAHDRHQGVEDQKLPGGQCANHHTTWSKACGAELHKANLGSDTPKACHHAPFATRALLVDLREESVCRVRDDRCCHARNGARGKRDTHLCATAQRLPVGQHAVDLLSGGTLHCKLGHGVRDLLEQDRDKTRIPACKALHLEKLRDRLNGALGKFLVRHLTDARGFQRAQEDIGDELCTCRSTQIDGIAVVPRLLVAKLLGKGYLEELEAAEFEPALDEVAHRCWAKASGQRTGSLSSNDLSEAANQALVVCHWVKLDARLHHIDRAEAPVGDGATQSTTEGAIEVVCGVVLGVVVDALCHSEGVVSV
mmetsp:Transcript_386/g.714  ORF Transcript_386/g.714 Transcript_386/m.714 type:complete len:321 (+) Transcript_386:70-1032(+)